MSRAFFSASRAARVCAFLVVVGAAAAAQGIQNGDFSSGGAGWTVAQSGGFFAPGSVTFANGRATLLEGDSFLVTLAQSFVVPPTAQSLSFDLFQIPGFDLGSAFVPDAFEVSLTTTGGAPLAPPWVSYASSYFNLQETGAANLGPWTTYDGQRVSVDLTTLAPGTPATLTFAFVGGDFDQGGGVQVGAVSLAVVCATPATWNLYGAGTGGAGGPPLVGLSGAPRLGTTSVVAVGNPTGAPTVGCAVLSAASSSAVEFGIAVHVDMSATYALMTDFALDPAGGAVSYAIPYDAAYCGVELFFQAFVYDASAAAGVAASSGLRSVLGY